MSAPQYFRILLNSIIYVVVTLLVIAAVSLSLVRVLLPGIEGYKSDIEIWLSDLIGQQIEIATLDAAWYGIEPQLVLQGVQLLSDDRMQTHGYFQQARLGIDLISSVLEGRVRPGAFTLEGARFVLVRQVDGNVTLEGFASPDSSSNAETNTLLEEWFFKQRLLVVKNSEIVWQDLARSKKRWIFTDVNLLFRNSGQQHWVEGDVRLPNTLGSQLKVSLDMRGNFLFSDTWSGTAYVEAKKLNVTEVSQNFSLENINVSDGLMSFRLWSQWRKAKLHSLQGNVLLNDVQLSAHDVPKIRTINEFQTNFVASKNLTDWEVTLNEINIESGRSVWPQTRLDLKYNPKLKSTIAEFTYVDLKDALPFIAFFNHKNKPLFRALNGINARGVVSNLNFVSNSEEEKNNFFIKGVFSNLNTRAWRELPGVNGLEGEFKVSNNAVELKFPSHNFSLDYRKMFDYKHFVKSFRGSLFANFSEGDVKVVAKDASFKFKKVDVNGSFKYVGLHDKPASLDLAYFFEGGRVKDVKYYIPSKIMPSASVEWLNDSLRRGRIKKGGLTYFGNLQAFPFESNDGIFNVNLEVENGELQFSDEWPIITAINGEFDLQANSYSFFGKSGKTMNSQLKDVWVNMPDYRAENKKLSIVGKALGETKNKLSYLLASSLGREYAKKVEPLQVTGESELLIDLNIPLSNPEKTKIFGDITLTKNHFLANEWKLDLENVDAALRFNNDGIWSDKLHANLLQTPIVAKVETIRDNKDAKIIINGESKVGDKSITKLLDYFIEKGHWGQFFDGETEINTKFTIPLLEDSEEFSFALQTDLLGMNVNLPYPLHKSAEENKSFDLFVELLGKKRKLKIDYGDTKSVFEIIATADDQQISRGAIGFSESVELPDEVGYRFSGKLKKFVWEEWSALLIPVDDGQALFEGGGSSGSIYFNIAVDSLSFFGTQFSNATVQASQTAQLWSIHFSGEELEGQVFIPVVLSSAPLVVDLKHLSIKQVETELESAELDPRKMPELKLKVKNFNYEGKAFGELDVHAKKIEQGLRLETFKMKTKKTSIFAEGDWVMLADGQKSTFDISIDSQNFGDAIKNWGYADAIGGGKGKINLKVNWPGKPSDFDFDIANGDIEIAMKDASMLDFKLGATRMIGLLLPRRLLLDFRDVFKKGMHFDEVKGAYQIQAGDAFTSGLYLNGPVADIHMAGRIGLIKHDYDQVVTVNRRIIGDSLPVLAVLATQPLIAAQVYIFKKMFEKQIDDILSIQYTIEGTWEDPVITPVLKNAATGEDLTEDILGE